MNTMDSSRQVGRSRRAILDLLKNEGELDTARLAGALGLTGMAVRQHLKALTDERLVLGRSETRGVGRPRRLWRLAPAAAEHFPDGHALFAAELVGLLHEELGRKATDKLLKRRAKRQAKSYRQALDQAAELAEQVATLARLRSAEGYMASVESAADGSLLLVERHCPLAAAARACQGALCAAEQRLYEEALGEAVTVERRETLAAGGRRCVFAFRGGPPAQRTAASRLST